MSLIPFRKPTPPPDDFEALLENELDGLFRVAMRYTRDAVMAEDLVHDTAVRALRFRDRFESGTNFKAWIYTILTNTFIHRYRRQRREREILQGVSRDDVRRQLRSDAAVEEAHAPEDAYLHNMLSDDVLSALDDLPEDFRSVVVLCDIEGLAYRDIADVVGCPVGTVMSRLYRGRRMLERKLAAVAIERGILKTPSAAELGTETSVSTGRGSGTALGDAVLDINAFRRRKSG